MPRTLAQLSGKVYDVSGSVVSGATVTFTHSTGTITETSNSVGEYIINYGGLSSWSVGDSATITANFDGKGTVTETVTMASGGTTLNLTLIETSSLRYLEKETNQYNLVFTVPTHFDGTKITTTDPLPVKTTNNSDIDLVNNPQNEWETTNQDGQPESETVTFANGEVYKRTFTYSTVSGMRILTLRSAWVKQ